MGEKVHNLDGHIWYRLLKVVYCTSWVVLLGVVFLTFYIAKPYSYVDRYKSYVTCGFKNDSYRLSALDRDPLIYGEEEAKKFCNSIAQNQEIVHDDGSIETGNGLIYSNEKQWVWDPTIVKDSEKGDWVVNTSLNKQRIIRASVPKDISYKLTPIHTNVSSWGNAFKLGVGVLVVGSIVLIILKKIILYIILGQSTSR